MKLRDLSPGDRVKCNVRGTKFKATVRSFPPGCVQVEPEEPKRITWRFVTARQVEGKVA